MEALYLACNEALDTYLSQILVKVVNIKNDHYNIFSLPWQSGPKKLSILELGIEVCQQLSIEDSVAMAILISGLQDDVTLSPVQILVGKISQQKKSADRLYVVTKSRLQLFGITHPRDNTTQRIDPVSHGSLANEAVCNLTQLVKQGNIII